jgi:hypothetical protein
MPEETAAPYAPYAPGEPSPDSFIGRLKRETAAVRLQYKKFGTRRALIPDQVYRAARVFGANQQFLSAGKRILNTKDPVWIAATGAIGRARLYWRTMTVPYPDKGIRLLRRELVPSFNVAMQAFAAELAEAKRALDEAYASLQNEARNSLGELFNPDDYPESVTESFYLEWDFPNVEPPDYLKELNPALWEQERQRLENRFAEAAALAENAFAAELSDLVTHLAERMTLDDDGKKKRLNKKAVDGFTEFFERLQKMRIGSNAQLDQIVEQARKVVGGIQVDEIRNNDVMRQNVLDQMQQLRGQIDTLLVEAPTRRIELEDE